MNRFVIVSGLPASGKSTVAHALGRVASLRVLDKDAFLESQFIASYPADEGERRRMSRSADRALEDVVRKSDGAIAVSWWRHSRSPSESGTPTEWLRELPGVAVEIYCRCPPEEAATRFLNRKRNPGHLDHRWSYDDLLAQLERSAKRGPIGLDHCVEVDTLDAVDIELLWQRVENAFRRAGRRTTI